MAAYMRKSGVVFSLMFFVMIGSLYAQGADVAAICGKAKNPSFCTSFMSSNPQASGADIPTLAKITFASAQSSASGAVSKIQSLAATETDPALKAAYTSCATQYGDAVSSLNDAKASLTSNDGPGLNTKVSAAMTGATACQGDVKSVKADPERRKK